MAARQSGPDGQKPKDRWAYGLIAVGLGLLAIVLAFFIVASRFNAAADVGSVLGIVVSPIATIVAAYFGVQAGSAGKETAEQNAKEANDKAIALASVDDSGAAQEALRSLRWANWICTLDRQELRLFP